MKNTIQKILKFRNDRNWYIHDSPKELSIAISIEASELLEIFQWKNSEEAVSTKLEDIKDELADVMMNCIVLAEDLGVDIEECLLNKLKKNEQKYPIEKFYGSNKKYNEI